MNPTPLLQYLQRRLHQSNTSDILILQEMLQQMAGIASFANLKEAQIEGLSCGPLVRGEVLLDLGDQRHLSRKSALRLVSCLLDLDIVSELFVLLAQQYKTAIFNIPDYQAHTKVLGSRFDDLSVILSQYVDLLNTFLLHEDVHCDKFEKVALSIPELCNDFGVDPVLAFSLWREKLGIDIREFDEKRWASRAERRDAVRAAVREKKILALKTLRDEKNKEDMNTKEQDDVKEDVKKEDVKKDDKEEKDEKEEEESRDDSKMEGVVTTKMAEENPVLEVMETEVIVDDGEIDEFFDNEQLEKEVRF